MEKLAGSDDAGRASSLPPPPPTIPPNVKPERVVTPKYSITTRRGVGSTGRRVSLLSNHFKVNVGVTDAVFYQYSVCLTSLSFQLLGTRYISVLNILCHTICRFLLLQRIIGLLKARE